MASSSSTGSARSGAATAGAELGWSASGLGGLGLDWIVGTASDGGGAEPSSAGEGGSGIMSGDSAAEWECWRGYSGAAEMADARSAEAAHAAWWSARTARMRRRPRIAFLFPSRGCACLAKWRCVCSARARAAFQVDAAAR
jgi:hypothetical protein